MRLAVLIALFGLPDASSLQDVLVRFGNSPLRNGDVDELCYRSESPLEPYWVLFGAGPEGDFERITRIRVVFSPPAMTCPPSARLTPELLTKLPQ